MGENDFSDVMERGVRAHQARRLDEALACYRAALALAPNDAEALSLYGLALLHSGQGEHALPQLIRAVELEPDQAGLRLNLVEGLTGANQFERAVSELRIVLTVDPGNARAHARFDDIAAAAGELQIARRDWQALHATAMAWTRVHPASDQAWRLAARAAFEQGRHIEACHSFARALNLAAPTVADLASYASLCLHALDTDAAAAALDKAEALDPEYPEALATRALLLMYLGRFEDAESCCCRCLARDPQNVSAYSTLSRVRRGRLADDELAAVTSMAGRHDLHLDRRIPAAFVVAHAHDARDDIGAAFSAYEHAHALAIERDSAEGRSYDRDQVGRRASRIMALADAPLGDRVSPVSGVRPIFIVGMPRSGTTLLESVLAAHSQVAARGERPTMQQILRAFLDLDAAGRRPDARVLQAWSTAYFAELQNLGAARHATDKHPLNFEAASLIAQLFPDAAIVHVRRNPLETCLSIYRQEFNKHWAFAHRLADIGHYYGHYARMVAHWERTLPGRFTTIQYENFVGDFERAAPELVRVCGLEWEPQCLDFQNTPRAIATFSTVQARDPVRLGNGRAKRYASYLAPLVQALEREGVNLGTGALL